jgi:hypothetical protein
LIEALFSNIQPDGGTDPRLRRDSRRIERRLAIRKNGRCVLGYSPTILTRWSLIFVGTKMSTPPAEYNRPLDLQTGQRTHQLLLLGHHIRATISWATLRVPWPSAHFLIAIWLSGLPLPENRLWQLRVAATLKILVLKKSF